MTSNQIVQIIYASVIGFLLGYHYGLMGLVLGVGLTLIAHSLGDLFGSDR